MSELGIVIFDLTATAKKREFFAAECKKQGFLKEAADNARIAAQYREAIERLKGKP